MGCLQTRAAPPCDQSCLCLCLWRVHVCCWWSSTSHIGNTSRACSSTIQQALAYLVAPDNGTLPDTTADFVVDTSLPLQTTFQYRLFTQLASGLWIPVPLDGDNGSEWLTTSEPAKSLTGLVPGSPYRLDVRGYAAAAVSSPVSWWWHSTPCPRCVDVYDECVCARESAG